MTFQAQLKKELIAKGVTVTSLTSRRGIATIHITNPSPSQRKLVDKTIVDSVAKLPQNEKGKVLALFWVANITYTDDLRQKAFEFMQEKFENYNKMTGTLKNNSNTMGNTFWVVQEVTQLLDGRLSFAELSKEFWAQN